MESEFLEIQGVRQFKTEQ